MKLRYLSIKEIKIVEAKIQEQKIIYKITKHANLL